MDTPPITDAEIRAMITMLRQRQDPIDLALANDLEHAYLRIQDQLKIARERIQLEREEGYRKE